MSKLPKQGPFAVKAACFQFSIFKRSLLVPTGAQKPRKACDSIKLCIFSDSHGYGDDMLRAIAENRPDMIVHLGDSGLELNKIKSQFPQIPLKAVRGNCDLWSKLPERDSFNLSGVEIFMTHGHLYNVKNGLSSLLNAGHFSGAQLVLYGHTHISHYERLGGMEALNPGSCGRGLSRSFALVVIGDDGSVACRILPL